MFSLLFSLSLVLATPTPVKRATATVSDIPSNCKVLDTLFLQCNNEGSLASLYPPQCTLDASGYAECCAVLADGTVTDLCAYDGLYSKTNTCKVLSDTLQLECYNNGGLTIASPICTIYSSGDAECCARNQDGSVSTNCQQSTDEDGDCTTLSDLTTQCKSGSTYVRTAPKCESIPDGHKCCAQYANGTLGNACQAVA